MYSFAKICRFCKKSDKQYINITSKMFREIKHTYNTLSKDTDAELNMYLQQVCQTCFQILSSVSDILSECYRTEINFRKYLTISKTIGKSCAKYECNIKDKVIHCTDINQCHNTIKKEFVENLNVPSTSNKYNENIMQTEIIKANIVDESNEQSNSDLNQYAVQCIFCHKKLNSTTNMNRHDAKLNMYLQQVCEICFQMLTSLSDILSECDRTDIVFKKYLAILETNGKSYAKCECIIKDRVIHYMDINQCHNTVKKEIVEDLNVPSKSNKYIENIMQTEVIKTEIVHEHNEQNKSDLNDFEERRNIEILDEMKFIAVEDIEHIYLESAGHDTLLNENNYNHPDFGGCKDNCKQESKKEEEENNILFNSKLNDSDINHFTFNSKQCTISYSQTQNAVQCSNLNRYVRNHTGERPFKCELCDKKFCRKKNLSAHIRFHTGERSFECDLCNKKFISKFNLNQHKIIHTGEHPFECGLCDKKFYRKQNFTEHARTHTGERPFECDLCNKKFSNKSNLKQHRITHNREHSFECDLCNKKFSTKSNVIKHKIIHTGEYPFECDLCNKKFYRKEYLTDHLHIHTGERPFECDVCNKTFYLKGNLNKHKRIHTRERPFECNVCTKRFYHKGNLNAHKLIHSDERPFQCDVCNKKFIRKGHLNVHKRSHRDKKKL